MPDAAEPGRYLFIAGKTEFAGKSGVIQRREAEWRQYLFSLDGFFPISIFRRAARHEMEKQNAYRDFGMTRGLHQALALKLIRVGTRVRFDIFWRVKRPERPPLAVLDGRGSVWGKEISLIHYGAREV